MVVDNEGAWDVDTVAIIVGTAPDPANIPPTADLSFTPNFGDDGTLVTLDASSSIDTDGTIVDYEWDFDGNGTYDGYGADSTVTHTYNSPGAFTSMVRVTDDRGAQGTAITEVTVLPGPWTMRGHDHCHTGRSLYVGAQTNNLKWSFTTGNGVDSSPVVGADGTVYAGSRDNKLYAFGSTQGNIPPTAVLQGSPLTGTDSIDVAFSAADSTDPDGTIDDYEWDFDGDGTYNESGAEADNQGDAAPALQTYTTGNPVVATVRVTDNSGAVDTASVTITVHGWGTPVTSDSAGSVGLFTSLVVVNGNPAISYCDEANNDLKYVRATDAVGGSWDSPQTLDSAGNVGMHTFLAVGNGSRHPAMRGLMISQISRRISVTLMTACLWLCC